MLKAGRGGGDVGEGEHRPVDDVERGGGRICEACVALARGRVKLTGLLCHILLM
jgi:hypothetical protein